MKHIWCVGVNDDLCQDSNFPLSFIHKEQRIAHGFTNTQILYNGSLEGGVCYISAIDHMMRRNRQQPGVTLWLFARTAEPHARAAS